MGRQNDTFGRPRRYGDPAKIQATRGIEVAPHNGAVNRPPKGRIRGETQGCARGHLYSFSPADEMLGLFVPSYLGALRQD